MTSNPKPEREKCPHDGHLLDRAGKCWYCGGIYPAGKPALTVVEAEPKVEGETSMESVEATLSLVKPDVRAGRYKVVAPMSRDRRPCRGDLFVKAGPRLRRLDCENCAAYKDRGGKCLGHRGWKAAREAGVKLEGEG